MEVFISWSGKRSKAFAYELSQWLGTVIQSIRPWMSEMDLRKGDRWLTIIREKLLNSKIGILCVTPENIDSPWLLFEAGALSTTLGESKVCPLLLGMLPSDVEGPISQFQSTTFVKDDVYKLIVTLNNELGNLKLQPRVLKASFEKFWPDLEAKTEKISKIGIDSGELKNVIDALQSYGFPQPAVGRVVCFKEGFESHALYQTAYSMAQKRLYIYGRKNRKFFDKEHWKYIESLSEKLSNGFDFRCLFLNPEAPAHVISEAHMDADFPEQLKKCITNANRVLTKYGTKPDTICRAYNSHRHTALIVVDNTVLFLPIEREKSGKAKALTKCGFEIVDATLPIGEELVNHFLKTWENSKPISEVI